MKEKLRNIYASGVVKTAGVVATLGLTGLAVPMLAHAQAVTLDATQAANISSATGSIPTTAASFILSSFQAVLPYILLLTGLFIAYRIIMHFVHKGH